MYRRSGRIVVPDTDGDRVAACHVSPPLDDEGEGWRDQPSWNPLGEVRWRGKLRGQRRRGLSVWREDRGAVRAKDVDGELVLLLVLELFEFPKEPDRDHDGDRTRDRRRLEDVNARADNRCDLSVGFGVSAGDDPVDAQPASLPRGAG